VLLARGQGEHVPGPALAIQRLADQPARNMADEPLAGRKEAQRRPTVLQSPTEPQPSPVTRSAPQFARRLQETERHRLGDADEKSAPTACAASAIGARSSITPKKFGYWTRTQAVSGPTVGLDRRKIGRARRSEWDLCEGQAQLCRVGVRHLAIFGMHRAPPRFCLRRSSLGHQDSLGCSGGPFIHRGVAHLHR